MQEYKVFIRLLPLVLEGEEEADELHCIIEERFDGVLHTSLIMTDTEEGFVEVTLWLEGFSASSAQIQAANMVLQALTSLLARLGREFPAITVASTAAEISDLDGLEEDPRATAPVLAVSVLDIEPIRALLPTGTIPERLEQVERWIQEWERTFRPLWEEVKVLLDDIKV